MKVFQLFLRIAVLFLALACDSGVAPNPVASAASSGSNQTSGDDPSVLPGSTVFASNDVLHFAFTLPAESWTQLSERGNEEEYVEASVQLEHPTLVASGSVGLRHKGNWTLHHCWDDFGGQRSYDDLCAKLSFKVKFDEYLPDQRVDGLKRLNLHALQVDQTKMHELIAYELFRDFGVVAPRTRPATVSVNGQNLGLFLAVEEVDGRFTKANFPTAGDGNLYKETWPNLEIGQEGFLEALETNEDVGDVSDISAFAQALDMATLQTFEQVLSSHVNIDQLLRYLVVDRALNNWDGISAFYERDKPHNFYWYHDALGSEQFVLIPWDLDNTLERDVFADPPESGVAPVPDWNQAPVNCEPRPTVHYVTVYPCRCDKLLDLLALAGWGRFDALGRQFLQQLFTVDRLRSKVDAWTTALEPWVADDPTIDQMWWTNAVEEWSENTLPQLVTSFDAFVSGGLVAEAPPPVIDVVPPAVSVTSDTGFSPTELNGFEFVAAAASGIPDGMASWTDEQSSVDIAINTQAPISGGADLVLHFTSGGVVETPYVGVGYYGAVADVRELQYLVITMRAEPSRLVRVALSSPVFDDEFGGAWAEFSVQVNVPEATKQFILPLADFGYPSWAKDAWTVDQGWTTSDDEAKALVLSQVNGVALNPALAPSGADSGRLFVDDVYFY